MIKKFVNICNNIQFLGLLGLLGLIFDNKMLYLLWLFWLFGFVDIIYKFPVFLQSLKQLCGLLYTLNYHHSYSFKYSLTL